MKVGLPRVLGVSLDERRVKQWAILPSWRLRRGNEYFLMKISGDSIEPLVRGGDMVLVNLSRHDPHRLTQRMVAAYVPDEGGATVKLLREDESKQFWLLLPYNPAHP